MVSKKFFIQKKLNAAEQLLSIQNAKCNILDKKIEKTQLTCLIELQPTSYSRSYKIKLKYDINTSHRRKVKVWVVEPQLKYPKNLMDIHVWPKERDLCLFYKGEWTPMKKIGETIIPWTAKWLYFYEAWEVTGKWLGGGIHPTPRSTKKLN